MKKHIIVILPQNTSLFPVSKAIFLPHPFFYSLSVLLSDKMQGNSFTLYYVDLSHLCIFEVICRSLEGEWVSLIIYNDFKF